MMLAATSKSRAVTGVGGYVPPVYRPQPTTVVVASTPKTRPVLIAKPPIPSSAIPNGVSAKQATSALPSTTNRVSAGNIQENGTAENGINGDKKKYLILAAVGAFVIWYAFYGRK